MSGFGICFGFRFLSSRLIWVLGLALAFSEIPSNGKPRFVCCFSIASMLQLHTSSHKLKASGKSSGLNTGALTMGRRALSVPEIATVLRHASEELPKIVLRAPFCHHRTVQYTPKTLFELSDYRWGHDSPFDSAAKLAGLHDPRAQSRSS